MKLVRLLTISMALFSLACTEGALESSRLSDLEPIQFNGSLSGTAITTSHSNYVPTTATCDKTTKNIMISTDGSTFGSISTFTGVSLDAVVEGCRKSGKLSVDLLSSAMLTFIQGTDDTKTLYFKAVSGEFESAISQLALTYDAPVVATGVPGYSTSLGSGTMTSANAEIVNYRIGKPVPSVMSSANAKIVPSN